MHVEYQIIKKKDNFCSTENEFINLLKTNCNYKIIEESKIIEYKTLNIRYKIKQYETENKDEIMFIIVFSLDDENLIEEFEKFDKAFLDFVSKFNDFSFNILWDDISRKYAEDMYPRIFLIENLLRKIIYYFMGKNVGNNWTRKCFPEIVDTSIKKVKDKNHINSDENILYYADFIQLNYLLFGKYSNETISQNELIEKLKDEKCNIEELISKYEYKSNWDRYFQPVVNKENLENNLNKLYCYRNLVAHNRKFRKNDKEETESLVAKIKKVLDNCLSEIDKIKVPEKEKENLENMSCQIFNPLTYEGNSNTIFQSVIDSAKINLGINPAFESAMNSVKTNLGLNPAFESAMNSAKINLGIHSKFTSEQNSTRINKNIKKATKKDENEDK